MLRKFAVIVMLMSVVYASASFAAVTPQQALSDQRIGPFVNSTKQNGAKLLPGRYAHTREIAQRSGGDKILAATSLILEIATLDPAQNTFSVNADLYGNDELMSMYMALDLSGEVPVIRTYIKDDDADDYELSGEDFAVVMTEGNNHIWCLGSVETGELGYLFPLDDAFFPEGWYSGTWKAKDGTTYSFAADGQAEINGQSAGKYLISDNRIIITHDDGEKEIIYAAYNTDTKSLVMTFTDREDLTAEVFTRTAEKKTAPKFPAPAKPEKKTSPIFTPPEKKTETQTQKMPSKFPEMPKVNMPKQNLNIDGVWGAYVNNQQWVMQFDGGQYFAWINGQPSEMGIIKIDGNIATGTNNNGVEFYTELELDPSGQSLTMTFRGGNSITYQRLQ